MAHRGGYVGAAPRWAYCGPVGFDRTDGISEIRRALADLAELVAITEDAVEQTLRQLADTGSSDHRARRLQKADDAADFAAAERRRASHWRAPEGATES